MSNAMFGMVGNTKMIPCPQSGMEKPRFSSVETTDLLNGMRHVRRSRASSSSYSPAWIGKVEDLNIIKDFYNGIYGDGPFYFVDPMLAGQNYLSPNYSMPFLAEELEHYHITGVRLARQTTSASVAQINEFTLNKLYSTQVTRKAAITAAEQQSAGPMTVPIPSGFKAVVDVYAPVAGNISVHTHPTGAASPAFIGAVALVATGAGRWRAVVDATTSDFVSLRFAQTGEVWALSVLLIPATATPDPLPKWTPGQGFRALQFSGPPQETAYMAPQVDGRSHVGLTVELVEV